jgi:glycosyltransferase involved in cell wall biosynthesis
MTGEERGVRTRGSGARAEVSVIIPCYNSAAYLGHQLRALSRQDYRGEWEVLVSDNGSSDGSKNIAETFHDGLNLRVVDASERRSASYARNAGARAATGDKLLFVDADDEVEPGYVAAMAEALESAAFVTSRVETARLNAEWNRSAHGPWQEEGLLYPWPDYMPAAGPNVGIARSVFESMGGYPEEIPTGSEDLAFAWKVQLHGVQLRFVPEAVYSYRNRDTLVGLYRQCRRWGICLAALYREFRGAGMPPRSWRDALRSWAAAVKQLSAARSRAEMAKALVELGYCVGRVKGSIRYRVVYL